MTSYFFLLLGGSTVVSAFVALVMLKAMDDAKLPRLMSIPISLLPLALNLAMIATLQMLKK